MASIAVHRDDDLLKIRLTNSSTALANAIRRSVVGETAATAVGSVEITTNSSLQCDELLAQRLGLIPVHASTSTARLALRASNPGEAPRDLMSDEISCPAGVSVMKDIPICRLAPGQEVDALLQLTKGFGRDHARFSPVIVSRYMGREAGTYVIELEGKGGTPPMDALRSALAGLRSRLLSIATEERLLKPSQS